MHLSVHVFLEQEECDRCYLCTGNPFVEVLFHNPESPYLDGDGQSAGLDRRTATYREGWNTVPVCPRRAFFRAVPVGTRFLLRVEALCNMVDAFSPGDQSHIIKSVRAQMAEAQSSSRKGRGGAEARRPSDHAVMQGVCKSMVRCYLNVTSVLRCREGFACVALSCVTTGALHAGKEVKNLYVAPQHLVVPEDDQQWDRAFAYVFV